MSKINTMKIRLLFIVTLLAGIVSACGEKDIAVFEGRNQIYFEKFYMNALYPGTKEADTTRTSFSFSGKYEGDKSEVGGESFRLGIGKRFAFWVENGGRGNNGKAGRV